MAKRTKKPVTNLPATWIEAEAVDTIARWIDRVADLMTSEEGRLRIRASLSEKFKGGAIPRMQVIAAADAGDQDADMVLRALEIEYMSLWGRSEPPPPELIAYFQRAALRAPAGASSGRDTGDIWKRDMGIAIIVQAAMGKWHLRRTRTHHSKKTGGLSAAYLVSLALGRRGINLSERSVEDISLADVQARLAERLSAFLLPV